MSRIVAGIQLDKAVPRPKRQRHGRWLKILDAMIVTTENKTGESFVVKDHYTRTVVHACARQRGMAIKSSTMENGDIRIWRVK